MSTSQSDSHSDLSAESIPVGGSSGVRSSGARRSIWLDGDVLACVCPDCEAPMSIRLWLMVADCFRCGASIELTEEEEQEALRLLRDQEQTKRTETRAAAATVVPTALRKPKPRPDSQPEPRTVPAAKTSASETVAERPRRVAASQTHRGARAHVRDLYKRGSAAVLLSRWVKFLPAWLISLVLHLVALLLLALWTMGAKDDRLGIILATSVGAERELGDQGQFENKLDDPHEFDDPGGAEFDSPREEQGAAHEPEIDFDSVESPLSTDNPLGDFPEQLVRPDSLFPFPQPGHMLAGRNPNVRAQMIEQWGGTSETEAAVARGLVFLARHQNPDGSWSLHELRHTADCDETCRGAGSMRNDVAATSMSLLAFLGAGQTPMRGIYRKEVHQGLKWLMEQQREDGDLRGNGDKNARMYAHAQAAIVLCEAYSGGYANSETRDAAQRALDFIVRAQHRQGGWRYTPGEAGDTSVFGWQLMALNLGKKAAFLEVPDETLKRAGKFLDLVQTDTRGGRYAYQRDTRRPTPTMTAEALLCRLYLGWSRDHTGMEAGIPYLVKENPPNSRRPNIYYWYYASQLLRQTGGEPWEEWNAKMRDVLVQSQQQQGHAAGSWAPQGGFAGRGGRIYMTSLAICTLEVYYRYLYLYGDEVLGEDR